LLTVGVFLNCFAQVALSLIQSTGRPDITAKLHIVELPLYLIILWWLIHNYGIVGAAIAWVLRVGSDAAFLYIFAVRLVPDSVLVIRKNVITLAFAIAILIMGGSLTGMSVKAGFLVVSAVIFGFVTWFHLLESEERLFVKSHLNIAAIFK
jgi:O-antigen/teichoic acid export membrane protein